MTYFVAVIPVPLAFALDHIIDTYESVTKEEQDKMVAALESFNRTFKRIATND